VSSTALPTSSSTFREKLLEVAGTAALKTTGGGLVLSSLSLLSSTAPSRLSARSPRVVLPGEAKEDARLLPGGSCCCAMRCNADNEPDSPDGRTAARWERGEVGADSRGVPWRELPRMLAISAGRGWRKWEGTPHDSNTH
jgi:hypothetical protein